MPEQQEFVDRYSGHLIRTLRLRIFNIPGKLGEVASTIGRCGAHLGNIHILDVDSTYKIREITVFCADQQQLENVIKQVGAIEGITILKITDDVLELHRGGVVEMRNRVELETLSDLRMVYTPGVASVCQEIVRDPDAAWELTGLGNKVAIVTNGTAVLGLGDIGPVAALPVMEGKAAIFRRFADISAEPVLVESKNVDEIVDVVAKIACNFGAIQLEDIAAPTCFTVEERLDAMLEKPVFHDDQHGTAVVVLAGLMNALKRVGKQIENITAAILGAGAAGIAIARLLLACGIKDLVLCDSRGTIYEGRAEGMNPYKEKLAAQTNRDGIKGGIAEALEGRDLFIGVSRPRMVTKEMIRTMATDPIVFALANPVSEISPREAVEAGAAVAVDGRGMNNALGYPGIFRGALDARAEAITTEMKLAASRALAKAAEQHELRDETTAYLLPYMFDMSVHSEVAAAVADAWRNRQATSR